MEKVSDSVKVNVHLLLENFVPCIFVAEMDNARCTAA